MAQFHATQKYLLVFLALVTYKFSLLTHGRHLKPLNQHSSFNTGNVVPKNNPHLPQPPLKTNVNSFPIPSSEKKIDSPMMTNHDLASFDDSGAAYTNAVRATTPGSSPGVGHKKFVEEGNKMKAMVVVQSPDVELSVTEGSINGFKPTNPGHSPGVGHSQQNNIGN